MDILSEVKFVLVHTSPGPFSLDNKVRVQLSWTRHAALKQVLFTSEEQYSGMSAVVTGNYKGTANAG